VTCDPLDDVVDNLSSLVVGVATKYAKYKYNETPWKRLYDSLCLLHELEDNLFRKLNEFEIEGVISRVSNNTENGLSGALLNIPPELLESTNKIGIKESINEITRQSSESDGGSSPSNSLLRTQFN
jgi:hypothetical protein